MRSFISSPSKDFIAVKVSPLLWRDYHGAVINLGGIISAKGKASDATTGWPWGTEMIGASLLLLFALDARTATLIEQISHAGHAVEVATRISERLNPSSRIAPGAPPVLAFRMLEGRRRHRFGDLDLMLDDAGH
jgi:hypothetical protein